MGWLVGVWLGLRNWASPGWWIGAWFDWWHICLHGGLASFVLEIVLLWFSSVLMSVYAKYSQPWHTIVCHDQLEGLPPKIGCLVHFPLGATNPPGYY